MGDLGQKCLSARFSAFKLISIYFTQTVLIETLSLNCLSYTPRRKFINRDRVKWDRFIYDCNNYNIFRLGPE